MLNISKIGVLYLLISKTASSSEVCLSENYVMLHLFVSSNMDVTVHSWQVKSSILVMKSRSLVSNIIILGLTPPHLPALQFPF